MSFRTLFRSRWFQQVAGFLAAEFLRFVWLTNRFSYDPPDLHEQIRSRLPVIGVFWHGQHFMMPFVVRKRYRFKVLISRHRDGEINAIACQRLGIGVLRGSGDHGSSFHRKGGVAAFKNMLRTLQDGCNIAVTADVPKVSRVAGLGVIMLARDSGRPIIPTAIATSRFKRLDNWDRSVVHLPFGRGVIAIGEALSVPADADADTMEALRVQLEANLNEVNRRAYAIVGRPDGALHGA